MGVLSAPEIREIYLSPKERAKARDSYARSFERQFRDWCAIAECCLAIERDRDWEILGFSSFHAWIMDAAPASRRYIYLVMGIYKDLSVDIPQEELEKMPVGTGAVLHQQVKSKKLRRDPRVLEASKQKPHDFAKAMQEIAPNQHVEGLVRKVVNFTASQWSVIEATFEKYQVMEDGSASFASFIEWMCSEVSEWTLHVNKENE